MDIIFFVLLCVSYLSLLLLFTMHYSPYVQKLKFLSRFRNLVMEETFFILCFSVVMFVQCVSFGIWEALHG